MPFHRLNIIDFYNNNMGNVYLADQLRNHYRQGCQFGGGDFNFYSQTHMFFTIKFILSTAAKQQ